VVVASDPLGVLVSTATFAGSVAFVGVGVAVSDSVVDAALPVVVEAVVVNERYVTRSAKQQQHHHHHRSLWAYTVRSGGYDIPGSLDFSRIHARSFSRVRSPEYTVGTPSR